MDVMSDVLTAARVSGGLSAQTHGRAPWGIALGNVDLIVFHILLEGTLHLTHAGGTVDAIAGDVVLLPHGGLHVVASSPDVTSMPLATLLARPGRRDGDPLVVGGDGALTRLLCGAWTLDSAANRLLAALPDVVHISPSVATSAQLAAAVMLLAGEVQQPRPGSQVVIDRTIESLLVLVLRSWLDQNPRCGGWLTGLEDPLVGNALAAMHHAPGQRWTVDSLARHVGTSRATLTRRFAEQIGQAPGAYLKAWRMTLATHALRDGTDTVEVIADSLGYDSPFAFSRAFKRAYGMPPTAFRAA